MFSLTSGRSFGWEEDELDSFGVYLIYWLSWPDKPELLQILVENKRFLKDPKQIIYSSYTEFQWYGQGEETLMS